MLIGLGLMVPLTFVEIAFAHGFRWKMAWLLACAAVALWLRWRERPPSKVTSAVLGAVLTALGPLSVHLGHPGFVELATIGVMPLVAAVLFLGAFEVVLAIALAGWVANTALFATQGWPLHDVLSVSARLFGASLVMALSSYWHRRMRRLDRELEREQGRALQLSETRRAQAERLAIVGRLASGVAHEVNNPMAWVKANVGLLEAHLAGRETLPAAEVVELIAETRQGIDRVNQIVADLKSYARDDTDVIEAVDLEALVRHSARLAAVRLPSNASLRLDFEAGLPQVQANARKLSQIVLNLLINAGDAVEAPKQSGTITVSARREGERVVLRVDDTGPGIAPEAMARLFEPFFTTKPPGKGTGLGLALSREYADAFGATVSVGNLEPHGASFSVSLAVAPSETP
jgi:signal transduction histidine kinase